MKNTEKVTTDWRQIPTERRAAKIRKTALGVLLVLAGFGLVAIQVVPWYAGFAVAGVGGFFVSQETMTTAGAWLVGMVRDLADIARGTAKE